MDNTNKKTNNAPAEKPAQSGAPRQGGHHNNRYGRHRRPNNRPAQQDGAAEKPLTADTAEVSAAQGEQQSAQRRPQTTQTSQTAQPAQTAQHPSHGGQPRGNNNNRRRGRQGNRPRPEQSSAQGGEAAAPQKSPSRPTPQRTPRATGRPTTYARERETVDDMAAEVVFISAPDAIPAPAPGVAVKVGDPDLSAFDFETYAPRRAAVNDPDAVEVIGVRFRRSGKAYYFSPGNIIMSVGDNVIVETARGPEFGEVCISNRRVSQKDIVQPLRPMLRPATAEDEEHNAQNRQREQEAFTLCQERIAKHKLDMKLVEAQYTFDNSKLLFYFTSAGRVDFRELVKDLASVFRTRIELRQIGIRDEAKLLGGLGACGRPLCCASFLADFVQVSIRMAKEQNLSLNSNKISGACGRLMCCLRYENDTYEAELRLTPPVDSHVRTPDGTGVVIEVSPLAGMVKVKLTDEAKQETVIKAYHRDDVTVLPRAHFVTDANNEPGRGEQ